MRKTIKNQAEPADLLSEDYLGYKDFILNGIEEIDVTIESLQVDQIPIPNSSQTKKKVVAILKGAKKVMIINGGRRNSLTRMFGPLKNWPGKKIKLRIDHTIRFKGEVTGGYVVVEEISHQTNPNT